MLALALCLVIIATVLESGGNGKQTGQLVKELRAAAQRAKSEFDCRPTSAKRHGLSQRWTSTDDDYLPDGTQPLRTDLQSRSRTHADLCGSRSRAGVDSRSSMDGDSSWRRQRRSSGSEAGCGTGRQRASVTSYDDFNDDDDVRDGLRRGAKTDLDRSLHTVSPRE